MAFPRPNDQPESFSPQASGNLLELRGIKLAYNQVWALKNINLTIRPGEIHALVGEHGSGKSSLAMLLSGHLKPDAGHIMFDRAFYRSLTLKTALKSGIEMVHQQTLSLNKYFTIAENFSSLINTPLYHFTWKGKRNRVAQAFFDSYDIDLNPDIPVEQLPLSDQIFVDILKHLYTNPRLLIIDEALEKLTLSAFHKMVGIFKKFIQAGRSILLVTYRIDDVYNLADRVSIIKHGEILITDEVRNIDKLNLIKMAYMQISDDKPAKNLNTEFYQLLRYNEAILRNLPVNLIVIDKENAIKLINDYCKQHFGLEARSHQDLPLHQLVSSPNDDIARLLAQPLTCTEENTWYQVPLTMNGIKTISNLKTFPIYDGALLIGTILTIEDMTEYDRLQKQMALSEKLASVGLLAAGVAHEINNPLEIIYTYLSYMKYKFRSQEFHQAIDTLHEQIADIANIVSNLQSFSDNTQEAHDDIDTNDVIRDMLHLVQHNAGYKHINIHFTPSEADILIRVNRHEIKQVILNLLKNSFEAMPSGGDIFISTALIRNGEQPLVQILFHDTGPGICDEKPENIFLPFYSTKHGSEQNLGLGLSVSYGIIKKYHGTITIENVDGAGCQFMIMLPQSG